MTDICKEVLAALAGARADPKATAIRIGGRLCGFDGKHYLAPMRSKTSQQAPLKVTKEGAAALHDALEFLSHQPALPGFSVEPELGLQLSAEDHALDVGGEGVASHTGSDGTSCWHRSARYGQWEGQCGECLWYGRVGPWVDGESIIDDLIIDDGVASRGHRLALFDERYNVAGVSVAAHETYGNIVAIELATCYVNDEDSIARRLKAGPPKLERVEGARAGEERTQWKIGKCKGCNMQIEGGQVVEAAGGKWHAQCFSCAHCQTSLVGAKQKKEEQGRIFCQSCWVELYAPTCFVCQCKIEGDRIKKGETYRHPTCRSSPPPAVLKPKPPMSTGAKSRARVPTAGSTVRMPTAGSNLTPVKAPPRTPCRKSRECPRMVVSEVTSTKRADRMVAKYGVGKHEVSGVSVGSVSVGKSVGVNARCAPIAATKRATQAKKASFTSAASSLNSMAFGYGDLTAAS